MTSPGIIVIARAGVPAVFPRPGATTLGGDDTFAAGRQVSWAGAEAIFAGWASLTGPLEIASFPHTETMIVLAGRLTVSEAGGPALGIAPGSGLAVGRGTALRLEAAAGTRWAFCATKGGAQATGVASLLADAALSPSAAPPPETLIGATPACRSFNAFTDATTRLRAGLWDSTPYRRVTRPHRANELMHIIAGSVTLTGEDGTATQAGPGDTVFVPYGVPCAWDSREPVAKFYVVQDLDRKP